MRWMIRVVERNLGTLRGCTQMDRSEILLRVVVDVWIQEL